MKRSLLFALTLVGFLDISNFFMATPLYAPLFYHSTLMRGYSNEMTSVLLGALVACYGLAQLFAAPIFAEFSDQKGRKKAILFSLGLAIIGCLLGGISLLFASLPLIFLSRLLIGSASGTIAIIFAVAADHSDDANRPKNLGYLNTGLTVGCVMGPIIGGHLVNPHVVSPSAYSLPFFVMAALYALNIFFLIKLLPNDKPLRSTKKRIHFFTAFHNMYLAITRSRYLCFMVLMALFFQIGTESFYLAAPVLGVKRFAMNSPEIANYFVVFGAIGFITSCWLNKVISGWWQSRSICRAVVGLYVLSMATLVVSQDKLSFVLPFIGVSIFGVLGWIHTNNLFSEGVDETEQGMIMGVSQSLWSSGGIIGSLLVGFLSAVHYEIVSCLPVVFVFLAFLMVWGWFRK